MIQFNSTRLADTFQNLIGWRQHHDSSEFEIAVGLTETDSGEYYQQKHPALRLDIIKSILPKNKTLDKYLEEKVRDASVEMLNDVFQYRNVKGYGKTLLQQSQLFNKYGWLNDTIVNQNRFVGFQIRLKTASGIQAVINKIGCQFDGAETFDLHIFHTSQIEPVETIQIETIEAGQWKWVDANFELNSFNETFNGGAFIIGYYQEDISVNAINQTDFDFDRGACGGCNASNHLAWKNINEYFTIYPIYVPQGSFTKMEMFDLNDAFYINNQTFGLNVRLSTQCDLTQFFVDNKFVMKNLLAYKVTSMVLNDMKYSQEINYIEENLKHMIIRDMEGDTETKMDNITTRYQKELKSVNFNIGGINEKCLPCEGEAYEPHFGYV